MAANDGQNRSYMSYQNIQVVVSNREFSILIRFAKIEYRKSNGNSNFCDYLQVSRGRHIMYNLYIESINLNK